MQSEAQLRQLIKQVSSLVNIPVSEATIKELIHAIKSSKVDQNSMEQLVKMISSKK